MTAVMRTRTPFNPSALAFSLVATLLVQAGCGGSTQAPPPEYPPVEKSDTEGLPSSGSVDPAVTHPSPGTVAHMTPSKAPEPVRVVAVPHTVLQGPSPTVKIVAPRNGAVVKKQVLLRLQVKNWATETDSKHVHLIIDNEPYIPLYDVKTPIDIAQLMRDKLGKELEPGTHVLRAFPGHPHHESVKTAGAFAVVMFHYQKKSEDFALDASAPLLTYSRPKGCVALGKPALLDFYVSGAALAADGYRVGYSIDERVTGQLADWVPYHIENLPKGKHSIRLVLLDATGSQVVGMFNDTVRDIEVSDACPPAGGHAGHSAPANSPAPATK
jgi:hypothetical protein